MTPLVGLSRENAEQHTAQEVVAFLMLSEIITRLGLKCVILADSRCFSRTRRLNGLQSHALNWKRAPTEHAMLHRYNLR